MRYATSVTPTLITIPFSHYCEKARWALDHAGLAYAEARHLPMFHWTATFTAGASRTVPALVSEEGVLGDSTDIVRYADRHAPAARRLLPGDHDARAACDALEDEFDESFGPAVRRIGYAHAFANERFLLALADGAAPPRWQLAAFRHTLPLARAVITRLLVINDATVATSRDTVRQTFDRVAATLRDGRRYLLGDRLSAADLTFAALAAPMVAPPEHPFPFPVDGVPEAIGAMWREMRAHAAGAFVLRLYADHRR